MIAGFTGTRHGMTPAQITEVGELLRKLTPECARHGDCGGADAQFHDLCIARFIPVVLHPPHDPRHRAFCAGAIQTKTPLGYLERDRRIVDGSDVLIATPREDIEPPPRRGQGTWYTVRYSRRAGVARYIVWPSGEITSD
jgi:hypothetical protein